MRIKCSKEHFLLKPQKSSTILTFYIFEWQKCARDLKIDLSYSIRFELLSRRASLLFRYCFIKHLEPTSENDLHISESKYLRKRTEDEHITKLWLPNIFQNNLKSFLISVDIKSINKIILKEEKFT